MEKYIPKSALIAEIKKHQAIWDGMDSDYNKGQRLAYSDVLSFLDTLEVKEVDLDRAIDKWIDDAAITHEDCSITDIMSTVKHFFELGLKAKGE